MEQFSETLRALAARVAWLERRQGRAALDPDDFAPAWEPPFAPTAGGAWLKITGNSTGSDLYSAVEVYHNQSLEGWTTLPGGIEVPAYQLQEVNGTTGIPNDRIVWAWPTSGADGQGWAFEYTKPAVATAFSGASAGISGGSQSISWGASVALSWSTSGGPTFDLYDTDAYWSAGQPTRLTVPADGTYQFAAGVDWGIPGTESGTYRACWFQASPLANGYAAVVPSTTVPVITYAERKLKLTAGTYVEVYVQHNGTGGGSRSVGGASRFQVVKLG